MKRQLSTLVFAATLIAGPVTGYADPSVVVSIKPVHSLVSAVMKGRGEPVLLIDGASSPHDFHLKPSQAAQLEKADLLFWIGHELEAFLEKPVETYKLGDRSVELIDASGIEVLGYREGARFEEHDHAHEDHEEHGHDEHDHEAHKEDEHAHEGHEEHGHDEHDHEAHKEDEHAHETHEEHGHDEHKDEHAHEGHGHGDHAHGGRDAHIWLDPVNAKAMVEAISAALIKIDPEFQSLYETNAKALDAELVQLISAIEKQVESARGRGFIVFHDAYHYFEHRFDVEAVGAISVNPETRPGAARVREVQSLLDETNTVCVFTEPQFDPKIVTSLLEGTNVKTGTLDPLGSDLKNGPELYGTLIRNLANNLTNCLKPS